MYAYRKVDLSKGKMVDVGNNPYSDGFQLAAVTISYTVSYKAVKGLYRLFLTTAPTRGGSIAKPSLFSQINF